MEKFIMQIVFEVPALNLSDAVSEAVEIRDKAKQCSPNARLVVFNVVPSQNLDNKGVDANGKK